MGLANACDQHVQILLASDFSNSYLLSKVSISLWSWGMQTKDRLVKVVQHLDTRIKQCGNNKGKV